MPEADKVDTIASRIREVIDEETLFIEELEAARIVTEAIYVVREGWEMRLSELEDEERENESDDDDGD